jgi:hypothetical protein
MTHEFISFQSARLQALQNKHQVLARQIDREHNRPAANPLYIRRLKMLKLRIKDEIEGERRRA